MKRVAMTKTDHGTVCHANVRSADAKKWEAQGWSRVPPKSPPKKK